jgi:hypothetical protein
LFKGYDSTLVVAFGVEAIATQVEIASALVGGVGLGFGGSVA